MSFRALAAVVVLSLGGSAAAQQQPQTPVSPGQSTSQSDTQPDPRDNRLPPLTPEQQREKEIRQFDPLAPADTGTDTTGDATDKDKAKDNDANSRGRRRNPANAPVPGSLGAEANAARQGPQIVDEEQEGADGQNYTGPAVLSRSYTVNRPLIPQDVKWQESVGLSAIFDTGLTTAMVTPTGTVGSAGDLYGNSVNWSLNGRHLWRRDQLGIHFSGSYQAYYPSSHGYTGANDTLSVDYTHAISRRLSVTLVGTASEFSQNYALDNPTVGPDTSIANINIASSPNIQIFDTTTKQFSLQANLTWQQTARLSYNIGGSYFAVVRDAPGLLGVGGEQASADVNYRWSRKATVGAYYSFSYYDFQHGAGTTDTNTVGLIYSYAFSKSLQLRLRGGGTRSESLGLTTVPLPPLLVALLGQATGIVDAYNRVRVSDFSGQLVKDFRSGRTASLAYARGISPGNGVFQTSEQESIIGTASARLFRRYMFSFSAGRNSLSSVSQTLGKYVSEFGTLTVSRDLRRGVSLNCGLSYRYFDIVTMTPVRSEVRITTGVSWTPGAGRLWPY